MGVPDWLASMEAIAHIHRRQSRVGETAQWPGWVSPRLRHAFARQGIESPWVHQADAADAAHAGHHVALATGTASGKSLAYLLPVLAATADGLLPEGCRVPGSRGQRSGLRVTSRPTALYIAPTKALAHDQLRACDELGIAEWRVAALDGDSGQDERRFARDFASYVLTNPDMLHRSVLPQHARFARLLGGLTHVVVDEAHRYKGLFGAHVSAVLRRLQRLAHHYGADPVFVCASATIAEPASVVATLIGSDDVVEITDDTSPRPGLDIVLLSPTPSLTATAAELLARFSDDGQALVFTTSRVQAELVAMRAKALSSNPGAIAAYRGGYLPGDRRSLETALSEGRLRGVASTNALELGIDIAGMDAVVTAGFPGTLAAFWQQVGRAGRNGHDAVAVLAAREDPLDAYLVAHPDLLFASAVERTVIPVSNPFVLGPHLCAAAQELPLTRDDVRWFGPDMNGVADRLTQQGALRRRPLGWFWTHPSRAVDSIDLRSTQGKPFEIVDAATGRVIGQVDAAAADQTVHAAAVYVHQGETWLIQEVEDADRIALARRADPTYFTQPQTVSSVRVLATQRSRPLGAGLLHSGTVELAHQVVSYLRRDAESGEVWDQTPLDYPERRMTTRSTWWTLPDHELATSGVDALALPGALHAAEHCAIGLLPAFVPCDRWDIGGLSTMAHQDTGCATVFVYDGLPGGSGIAERGFDLAEQWCAATADRLSTCPCELGCPACVVSPKCGSGNNPLDKLGARVLLSLLLRPSR